MKLLLLSILTITLFQTEGNIITTGTDTTITCKDGFAPGIRSDASCYCECESAISEISCVSQSELETAKRVAESATTTIDARDTANDILTKFMHYCSYANPSLYKCDNKFLVRDVLGTTCDCPTCNQEAICSYADANARYICSEGACYRNNVCSLDSDGFAQFERSVTSVDDSTFCERDCLTITDRIDPIDPIPDPCLLDSVKIALDDNGCFRPCLTNTIDGTRRISDVTVDDASLVADRSEIEAVISAYATRNPPLIDCPKDRILPKDDGCGFICRHKCDDPKIIVKHTDSGKCFVRTCTDEDHIIEFKDPDTGVVHRFLNVRRKINDGALYACDTLYDQRDVEREPVDRTGKDDDTICAEPCAFDHERPVCVTYANGDSKETKTFECGQAAYCALREASQTFSSSDVSIFKGRCGDPTIDECVLDDIRVTDDVIANSKCPRICTCVENADGKNVMRCGGIRSCFPNLRKKCAARLDKRGCTADNMFFDTCPSRDDTVSELCDKLYCDPDADPNDVVGGAVCRVSGERLEGNTPTRQGDKTDSKCVAKMCSDTFDSLIDCAYSDDVSIDSNCERLSNVCPGLKDCRDGKVDTGGACDICPFSCADDVDNEVACARNRPRRGDRACREDSDGDITRPGEPAARVRVTNIGVKICLDEFGDFTGDDIYSFIKRSILKVCETCNIEIDNLRAYIKAFDFDVIISDDPSTDGCDTMVLIKATIDITDINKERLIVLIKCLNELGLDDILVKVRDAFVDTTKGERLEVTGETDNEAVAVRSDGVTASAAAAANVGTTIDLYNGDGTQTLPYDTIDDLSTTPVGGCGEQGCHGNSVAGYAIIATLIVSFVAMLF